MMQFSCQIFNNQVYWPFGHYCSSHCNINYNVKGIDSRRCLFCSVLVKVNSLHIGPTVLIIRPLCVLHLAADIVYRLIKQVLLDMLFLKPMNATRLLPKPHRPWKYLPPITMTTRLPDGVTWSTRSNYEYGIGLDLNRCDCIKDRLGLLRYLL